MTCMSPKPLSARLVRISQPKPPAPMTSTLHCDLRNVFVLWRTSTRLSAGEHRKDTCVGATMNKYRPDTSYSRLARLECLVGTRCHAHQHKWKETFVSDDNGRLLPSSTLSLVLRSSWTVQLTPGPIKDLVDVGIAPRTGSGGRHAWLWTKVAKVGYACVSSHASRCGVWRVRVRVRVRVRAPPLGRHAAAASFLPAAEARAHQHHHRGWNPKSGIRVGLCAGRSVRRIDALCVLRLHVCMGTSSVPVRTVRRRYSTACEARAHADWAAPLHSRIMAGVFRHRLHSHLAKRVFAGCFAPGEGPTHGALCVRTVGTGLGRPIPLALLISRASFLT